MVSAMFSNFITGTEPILEKRAVIISKRCTSFSISVVYSAENCVGSLLKNATQPINEAMGVPNWCAVSLASPTHTRFCSAVREALNTM